MLVINAGNLMKGVIGALKAAEAASVKVSNLSIYLYQSGKKLIMFHRNVLHVQS